MGYEYPLAPGLSLNEFLCYLDKTRKVIVLSQKIKVKNNFFTGCEIRLISETKTRARVDVKLPNDSCIML